MIMSELLRTFGLFVVTAMAEIIGFYLPYLWLKQGKSIWLLIPAMFALAVFVWLLTLHPFSAGRTYAAYGGGYILVAIIWLWLIDHIKPTPWDMVGAAVALAGMAIIVLQPQHLV